MISRRNLIIAGLLGIWSLAGISLCQSRIPTTEGRIGWRSQWMYPGNSACGRCQTTWNLVDERSVQLEDPEDGIGKGFFSLCVACWKETTIEERIAYTRKDYARYWRDGGIPLERYEQAVRRDSLKELKGKLV